jgi:hypothetical protein
MHRDAAAMPSHRSSVSNRAAVSTVKPSMRGPSGVMRTITAPVSLAAAEWRTAIGRNRGRLAAARVHRWSVVTDTPNAAAIVRTPSSLRR